jgi:hypothetical protein
MLTVFLSIHGAIFIGWLSPGEKFHNRYFCEKYSSRLPRSCTTGAVQVSQDRQCILTKPQLIDQQSLRIVSCVADSDTLPSIPISLISVPGTSSYLVI